VRLERLPRMCQLESIIAKQSRDNLVDFQERKIPSNAEMASSAKLLQLNSPLA